MSLNGTSTRSWLGALISALSLVSAGVAAPAAAEMAVLVRGETISQHALPPLLVLPGGFLEVHDLFFDFAAIPYRDGDVLARDTDGASVLGLGGSFAPPVGEAFYFDPALGALLRASATASNSAEFLQTRLHLETGVSGSVAELLEPVGAVLVFGADAPGGGAPGGGGSSGGGGSDRDLDGVSDGSDNCPNAPNGSDAGTCTAGDFALLGELCLLDSECGSGGFCSRAQEDGNADGLGDACDPTLVPEPGKLSMLAVGICVLLLLARRRGGARVFGGSSRCRR